MLKKHFRKCMAMEKSLNGLRKKQTTKIYTTKNMPKRLITCGGIPSEYKLE